MWTLTYGSGDHMSIYGRIPIGENNNNILMHIGNISGATRLDFQPE